MKIIDEQIRKAVQELLDALPRCNHYEGCKRPATTHNENRASVYCLDHAPHPYEATGGQQQRWKDSDTGPKIRNLERLLAHSETNEPHLSSKIPIEVEGASSIIRARRAAMASLRDAVGPAFEKFSADLADLLAPYDRLDVIRYLLRPLAPTDERTGLPCHDCGVPQRRLGIDRLPDGSLVVRVSCHIPFGKVESEIKGLCSLLKMFATK